MWENLGSGVRVANGDCLEVMRDIPAKCVDMVLADPPYGTTACKWDSVIPFEPMWEALRRVTKPQAAIVLFGSEPFSSHLRLSNLPMFKYDWIWEKSKAVGFVNAKLKPMLKHEIISVFSDGTTANKSSRNMPYFPQGLVPLQKWVRGRQGSHTDADGNGYGRPSMKAVVFQESTNYPVSLLRIPSEGKTVHPTQKPVVLMEYLLKTYTNENDVVLDFTMGSGTTGVACVNLNRRFIGIEKDASYYEIAKKRITEAQVK